jgi:hypothetical protein
MSSTKAVVVWDGWGRMPAALVTLPVPSTIMKTADTPIEDDEVMSAHPTVKEAPP